MAKQSSRLSKSQLAKIKNEMADSFRNEILANGLQGVLFGSNGFPGSGFPSGPGNQNVSQVNEIFGQLRWYFISNFRQVCSEIYSEIALIQTIVNVPVDDGLRGGIELISKQLSPQDLNLLRDTMEREEDIHHFSMGLKWARLFGGGGVLAITNQDPATPFRPLRVGDPLEFRAFDLWELFFSLQNTNANASNGGPQMNSLPLVDRMTEFDYYGQKVHASRVFRQTYIEAPSFLRPRLRGWGLSVLETLVRSLNQYLEGTSLIYELIDEAKIDVYGIKNLTSTLLAPNGNLAVRQRIQIANQSKDFQHAIVMDAEDKYDQKTLTFSGLADVMEQIRTQVASDLRMPKTKLFGESANGFNSGEADLEVYNGMIESTIRTPAKKYLLKIAQLRCQTLFGYCPDDLSIKFPPLRVLSAETEAKVKDSAHNRLLSSAQAGLISLEEYREACNKHDLLGIQLNNDILPEGSDELGSIPGESEEENAVDEAESEEEVKDNSPIGENPPAKD
jgi:phage-related protein (TIGR01555 family)